ncbi:hypothetical protein PITC_031670 [Penicillium italicum]|uniref:Uncharacterized protein n=1 Tax=Penicillium italicum TaxID=40296 RepID=A0A0A2L4K3_PENIT|nr:hypothetical protein PITC_031670 [Penicillium italicum]
MRSPRNKNRRGILINAKQKKNKETKKKRSRRRNQPDRQGPMSKYPDQRETERN